MTIPRDLEVRPDAAPDERTSGPTGPPGSSDTADMALVHRFVGGDETAFVEIMRRYQARIFSVAFQRIHNHADAEEITQDTFVRVHRNLPFFRGDSSLATWLHTIAVNLTRNRYWYYFRRARHTTLSLDHPIGVEGTGTIADLLAASAPNPAQQSVRDEFARVVAGCAQGLEAQDQEILNLRTLQDHSYDEIARHLGIKIGTVKSRMARARARLRARLAEACPEFPPEAELADCFEPWRMGHRLSPPSE
jgi:RNA polymerase sigma-70 factor (ECF subfamily)